MRAKLIVAAFFVVLTTMCVCLAVWYSHAPATDPNTGCQIGRTNRPVTVIIFDQSDQFERGDLERSREMTTKIIESLDTDEKLVALELDPGAPHEPRILFDHCAPKCRTDWNMFFDNIKKLKTETDKFSTEFQIAIKGALERKVLPKSPILETLSYASTRSDFKSATSKRIYLFSDLLQNYGKLDFYRNVPNAATIYEDLISIEPVSLTETKVYLLPAARRQHWVKRPNVHMFWNEWLKARGAIPEWQFSTGTSVNNTR